ncbi:DUF3783 domain-containing protein [Clostridium tyrobutyricum]|jgi:hypothetical protein|uniref:Conserved protein n=1 Tax=Clostridium tyrobutyricum DIVETGP TaxID=1408889 RepID=W6N4T8_CLOTY|nr:DUF3783 domain-containing protein [Clostridium tyrobutyricum]AND86210.1 hypothetical protein CTK_C29720 [Clostridium tyrobutyricum]ANP70701.1 hypothetical protein BA182_13815 [Clostridium tyrobutyricum]MBR9648118.1 DUF3783 domain-containing protein [Clostridium tyrobutyricum]MBV4416717.1 DUF3783 domain-containing protein [Clostridium tyrobutyricum]MBV4422590.1 DUF3783 domain-containing protein [Clostridium tyrobutyricum]
MTLKNNKFIITYGLDNKENEVIDKISNSKNFSSHKIIEKSMAGMKLKDIIDESTNIIKAVKIPDEKIILFNNLTESELSSSMKEIKSGFLTSPIFAVVTQTSVEWTFDYLINHLMQEREWFKKQQQQKKK